MYKKTTSGWIKHWDFGLIDIFCMETSFFLAYILRHGRVLYDTGMLYFKMGINLLIIHLVVTFLCISYKNILKRNKWQEVRATVKHVTLVQVIFLLYEYLVKEADMLSRIVFIVCYVFSLLSCYFARIIWKKSVRRKVIMDRSQKKMLVISSEENMEQCLLALLKKEYREFDIVSVALFENTNQTIKKIHEIPIIIGKEQILEYIRQNVVDEVLIDDCKEKKELDYWVDIFLKMGITTHISMGYLPENLPNKLVEKIGLTHVVTTSIKTANGWEIVCKRMMDILGGIVGLILTGIAYIFVAPAIKLASPGPIFFKQSRVGKNGRLFNIYKFRSMYLDAEERKKELMKYNEMQGLMFKMENDPRIIGSEKGPGRGIGNFIRKTSIDELPQFLNILKGDMSLVGTRPPTLNEYEQYQLHHKIRLSMKPGLTGLWQVSGRSDITDFEEIVKLDAEYIENWSLLLDIKLILKTIKVVIMKTGSK